MTNSEIRGWLELPDLIFGDIMLMVGLEGFESLHRCRQVCKTWNDKILTVIWGNLTKRKRIQLKIEEYWNINIIASRNRLKYDFRGDLDLSEIFSDIPSSEEVSHVRWLGKFQDHPFNKEGN